MPTPLLDLTDEQICATFPRLVQIDGTKLYDGLGNLILDFSTIGVSTGPAVTGSAVILLTPGDNTILQINKSLFKGAFFDYVLYDNINQRSGTLTITNTGVQVEFTEQSTNDIGNTSEITVDSIINGATFDIRFLGIPNSGYHIRYIYKYI